ncbi:PREDICTED: GDSL esterase/lipase At1g23500-like [Tarenaya hassleriana]|uniref:GDSL esterase/lipase At1g23500-like n=1 Tax=Tarenaya hassleriana TaxID=28532 RepID=UPI00053C434B|nr:PREDICTED: GDSL esterase/lipase At1g23500-like [Tarenaya hassleriana]
MHTYIRENAAFPAIFAFGDSILDTGNNNNLRTLSKCNFFPYGRDFIGGKATGRFGNGRVLSDIIAEGLGIKDLLAAYRDPDLSNNDIRNGVSFASGGSGLDDITATSQGVIWVPEQLNDFKDYIQKLNSIVGSEEKTKEIILNAIFLISAGNNDLAITYFSTSSRRFQYTVPAYTDQMITWTRSFLQNLYDLGARKFAVLGTLPLGCLPGARNSFGGILKLCLNYINEAADMFNEKLSFELNKLNTTLIGAKFVYVDMYHPLLDFVNNPQKDGFINVADGCCCMSTVPTPCMDASQYVFWDYGHPTEKSHKTIAPRIVEEIKGSLGFIDVAGGCCCMATSPILCMDASQYIFWDIGHPTEKSYKTIAPRIVEKIQRNLA